MEMNCFCDLEYGRHVAGRTNYCLYIYIGSCTDLQIAFIVSALSRVY
jgi:hypothetical protein